MNKSLKLTGKYILSAAIVATIGCSGCSKDDDNPEPQPTPAPVPTYTVPATYAFIDAAGNSTVSFSGQIERLAMLSEMVTSMKTGNTQGTVLSALTFDNMYANNGHTWTDAGNLGLTGSSKQLRSKTAAGDVGVQTMFENYFDSMEVFSALNMVGSYGQAGVWTNGTKNYLQSATGIEYGQLIEKGLMRAVFANQMTNNYLNLVPNDNNTSLVSGKNYTDMQHHWDEAYGYFTSEIDFPTNGTDRFWGKYADGREAILGSATKLSDAFRKGRAAIDNNDNATRNAQIDIIKNEMEKVAAGTAIHYLNEAKANIADPTIKNHVLSEAWAFLDGLRYGDNAIAGTGMVAADIDTALAYFGTDFSVVTITDLNNAIDLIASKTGLESVKASL